MSVDYQIPGEIGGDEVRLEFTRQGNKVHIKAVGTAQALFTFLPNGTVKRGKNIPEDLGFKLDNQGRIELNTREVI